MKTSPHCINSKLTRRQFLAALTALGGLSWLVKAASASEASSPETLPVWWTELQTGRVHAPIGLPVPAGEPGSLMKLVVATVLLEDRLLTPNERFECRGSLRMGDAVFHCQHAHGRLSLREALGYSCNLFFVQASAGLSAQRFLQMARRFRLDQPVGKPARHAHGTFPSMQNVTGPSALYVLGLQSDLRPDALQLMRLAGLIATRRVPGIQDSTWELLQAGMRLAATDGTGAALDPENRWRSAIKTGTAPHGQTYQSWLIGYFPFENPRYAFCVRSQAGTAKDTAVPIARRYLLSRDWS